MCASRKDGVPEHPRTGILTQTECSKVVFCRVHTKHTRGIFPGHYPTKNFWKFTRTRTFWKFCKPVAIIPGVREMHGLYPLGTSVSTVRLCHNTRNFWKFCKILIPLPGNSVTPARLWHNTRGTGIPSLQFPGSSMFAGRPGGVSGYPRALYRSVS